MRFKVLIAEPERFSPAALTILESVAKVDLIDVRGEALARAFSEYDVIWVRLRERITEDVFGVAPRCRVVATATTGLDHIDLVAAERLGVKIISLRGENAFLSEVRATAELTIALTLALLRRIPAAAEAACSGIWDRDRFVGRELCGRTVGIIGVGRLGHLVARYFRAFDAAVVGFDRRSDVEDPNVEMLPDLESLLECSDIVTLHVPLDESTRGLIGAEQLARMKSEAVLVNTSRGPIVDEAALVRAIRSGGIGGAALDVLSAEPNVSADDPVLTLARQSDRLIVVPHIGGKALESMEKTEVFIAQKVVEALGEVA